MLILLVTTSLYAQAQSLGDGYKDTYTALKADKTVKKINYNADETRKWINYESELGWKSHGFALDQDFCEVIILTPYTVADVNALVAALNKSLVIIDRNNWEVYRRDGSIVRVTLKPVEDNLVFYYYFVKL